MLFTSVVSKETTSYVTFYILRHKVLKVSNGEFSIVRTATQRTLCVGGVRDPVLHHSPVEP